MTFSVQSDRNLVRAGVSSVRYALLSFAAPDSTRVGSRPPINVAFVIDRSGSMGGSKIELARAAVTQALRMLKAADRFSIVSYDNQVDVVVPSTLATGEAVRNAVRQVESLQARGSTDLGAGWLKGCEQVAEHLQADGNGLCLLLSDGLANHGITDPQELAAHAEALHRRGITTSCFGIGDDYDERLLAGLAMASAGHFYYVETPVQIPDYLTSALGEALDIVARDVTVTVRVPEGTTVGTLNRFSLRPNGAGTVSVSIGDLPARQEVSVVFRLQFPAGDQGQTVSAVFGIGDAAGALRAPDADRVWTYADHEANDTQPRNVVVDRAVAHLYAATAKADALELNREGRFDEARARLEATARRIAEYAGQDPELRAIVAELKERNDIYSAPMDSRSMKSEYAASYNVHRMRNPEGKARRRPN